MTQATIELLKKNKVIETRHVGTETKRHTHFKKLSGYEAFHARGEMLPVKFGRNPHWDEVKRGETREFPIDDIIVRISHS